MKRMLGRKKKETPSAVEDESIEIKKTEDGKIVTKTSTATSPTKESALSSVDLVEDADDMMTDDVGELLDALKGLKKQIKRVKNTQLRSMKQVEKYFDAIDDSGILQQSEEDEQLAEAQGKSNDLLVAKKEAVSKSARKLRTALVALQQAQDDFADVIVKDLSIQL